MNGPIHCGVLKHLYKSVCMQLYSSSPPVFLLFPYAANDPNRKTLSKELEEEENALKQCIQKLKVVEANRAVLVSQLKEALNEQVTETNLEFVLYVPIL